MKYKIQNWNVGDKAKCVANLECSCDSDRQKYARGELKSILVVGQVYEVVAVNKHNDGEEFISVIGGDGTYVNGTYGHLFTKLNNNNKLMKITNLVKKILDEDTRKLVKAGFINGDLALTDEGIAELLGILFLNHKDELVKIADEKINCEKE